MEIYKDIEGFKGLYQISNLGNVKSLNYNHTGKEKVLKPKKDKNKYLFVSLSKQGKVKHHFIHCLVAQAFLPNPNNFSEVNHKDEDKQNNHISNLEFCNRRFNCNFGTRNQRIVEKTSKQVLCLETGVVYPSTRAVEKELGFSQGNISKCCRGKLKTAYKFHWKYVS